MNLKDGVPSSTAMKNEPWREAGNDRGESREIEGVENLGFVNGEQEKTWLKIPDSVKYTIKLLRDGSDVGPSQHS